MGIGLVMLVLATQGPLERVVSPYVVCALNILKTIPKLKANIRPHTCSFLHRPVLPCFLFHLIMKNNKKAENNQKWLWVKVREGEVKQVRKGVD